MSEAEGGRRAKRRCARSKYTPSAMPSAIHYVGYVEDDETPEMIMAKFLELERIQQAAGNAKAVRAAAAADEAAAAAAAAAAMDGGQQQQQQCTDQQLSGVAADGLGQQQQTGAPGAAVEQQQQKGSGGGGSGDEGGGGGLTDEQLLEVFKQTSMFNVRTAMQDNEMLLGIDEILEHTNDRYGDEDNVSDDDDMLRAFWSDDEDDMTLSDPDEDEGGGRRSRARRAGGGAGGRMARQGSGAGRVQRNGACVKARHNVITAFNPVTQALVRRKVKAGSERDELYHVRVPPAPLPVSWGRTVQPYVPAHLRGERQMAVPVPPALLKAIQAGDKSMDLQAMEGCRYHEQRSIPQADWGRLLSSGGSSSGGGSSGSGGHQAVLINPGWECEGRGDAAVQRLAQLPMRRLVPKGFVFIFVEKQHVQALCRQMRAWGYCYIENLTWVYLRPNNQILALPSRYSNNSHITLYMFRREGGDGKGIELRHQRNPDVTFDCLATADGVRRAVPEETFVAIETLLPTGKGSFLELWAPRGVRRPGWSHVVEVGAGAAEC